MIISLLGLLAGQLASQVLPFHFYSTKDGLASNDIHTLYQDSRGFLWIGTAEGLSVYDGNTFRNYTADDGLASGFVNDIVEDRTTPGTLWIGTYGGGVNKYSQGKFSTYHLGSRTISDFVGTLMQDHRGVLWCGSDSGVVLLENGAVTAFHPEAGFRAVKGIVELNDSTVWISSNSGLFCYSRTSGKLEKIDILEPEQQAEAMCLDHRGDLWVGTYGGAILQIRGNKIVRRGLSGLHRSSGYDTFNSLRDDDKGNLWAATRSGLLKISKNLLAPEGVSRYTIENGLPEDQVFTFMIDREENLWVGSLTRGIAKLTKNNLYRIILPGFAFYAINNSGGVADRWGHIWLVCSQGLWEIWRDDRGQWQKFFHRLSDQQSRESISAIVSNDQDQLWVASSPPRIRRFVVLRDDRRPSKLSMDKQIPLPKDQVPEILCFLIDRKGNAWISGKIGIVVEISQSGQVLHTFTEADGIPGTSIRALFEDHEGNIWIGGGYGGGIVMIPGGDWREPVKCRYTLQNGLPNDFVRAFGEDEKGRLLVGTRFGGLSILDHDRFVTYTTKNGLNSNGIWGITRDSSGNIVLGTHRGLQVFNETRHNLFESDPELIGGPVWSSGVYQKYDAWLVQQDALIIYEYSRHEQAHVPPPVYITRLTVNGKPKPPEHASEFAYDENNIVLDFVGLSFRDEQANRYRYRLLDNDNDWRPLSRQTSVTYGALKPGKYTFEVKAINGDGIESTVPAAFQFVILSPFWMRWWFILCANIAVLGFIVAVYRYRLEQAMRLERMRTRIATDLHDDIGSSLSRIALFSEVVRAEAAKASPRLVEVAEKIGENARELLDSIGTLVWSIDPRHDRFEDVAIHLKNFAQEMFSLKGISYHVVIDPKTSQLQLPLDARKNVLLIFKEAVNNIIKHAHCSNVDIRIALADSVLHMTIRDNGRGLGGLEDRKGHGLTNMRMRAAAIGGQLEIRSNDDGGTVVILRLPLRK